MKNLNFTLVALVILFANNLSHAHVPYDCNYKSDTIIHYVDLDNSTCFGPYYAQGIDSLMRFLSRSGNPCPLYNGGRDAKARVFVKFDIDRNGTTLNPEVLKIVRVYYDESDKILEKYLTPEVWLKDIDLNYCKNEAFRLIRLLKFKPARRNNVELYYSGFVIPIYVVYPASSHD